ncbi:MAG: CRISPR-associated RAMP protein [Chloroflexi bacterium]|nr:CRISPR-associated RAMP protein [Chloroflexota bacterium]
MLFDTFHNRTILTLELRAETAVRIGAGRALEPTGADLPVIKDATGRPYIPGSSLKGVLRSRLESFVRAVYPGRKGACNPLQDTERCIRPGEWQPGAWVTRQGQQVWQIAATEEARRAWRYPAGGMPDDEAVSGPFGIRDLGKGLEARQDVELARRILAESCLVCQVFGSPWLASHVYFRDLAVDPAYWFNQLQVRNGVAIDRDTETAHEGQLYDYEVVPAGTRFTGQVVVENATDWQLGLLAAGLREMGEGRLAVGGATSRGLGVMTLDWEGFMVDQAHLLDYLADSRQGQTTIDAALVVTWRRSLVAHLREEGGHAQVPA